MKVDGSFTDVKDPRNVPGALPPRHPLQHFLLSERQRAGGSGTFALYGSAQCLMEMGDEDIEYCCSALIVLDGPAGKGEQAPLFAGEAPNSVRVPAVKAEIFGEGKELLRGRHFSVGIGPILYPEAFEIFLQNRIDLLVISRDIKLYPF